jgi:hypothetical protein
VYAAYVLGVAPYRILLILLDNRTRRAPYEDAVDQDMLGPAQWAWLEAVLRDPAYAAEVTVIGAGLQMLSRGDPGVSESFSRHPQSQAKLLALLAATRGAGAGAGGAGGVLLLSGDVHFTELSRVWLASPAPPSLLCPPSPSPWAFARWWPKWPMTTPSAPPG